MQAYANNSSIYIGIPVKEREDKLKYALNVMGCKILPYWLGTFLFDFSVYFLSVIVFFIMLYCWNITYLIIHIQKILLIMVTFGFALINLAYVCGFMFDKSNSAYKYFPVMNVFILYGIPYLVTQWNILFILFLFKRFSE